MDDRTRTRNQSPRGSSRGEPGGIRLFAAGTAFGSRFEIRSVRGTGGSAVVYSAFDRDLKQVVALKVLRADRTSPAALARLRREVAIARQAASPRLVRVFDIDASGELVFLSMEDVEGGSLRERLAEGTLPLEETLRMAGEILEGLAVLHGLGIVHRDVKPGNVLLAADGSVKLADFGLARHFEADETRATATDAIVGTVEYLSPEQALGRELDGRSDLYSFGVTLFEMLTGGVPFRRDSAISTALAHVREPAPRLRSVRPDAPAWLDAFVARLLAKAPEERCAAAEEALADLKARRASGAARSRGGRLAVAAALGLVVVAAAVVSLSPRAFRSRLPARIESRSSLHGGVIAVDARGRALWERPEVWTRPHATLYRRADGEVGIVAILTRRGMFEGLGARIDFLSPETGKTVGSMEVRLPTSDQDFQTGTRWGLTSIEAFDVDGNGSDELVFVVNDAESFPSAAFLVEPEARWAEQIFIGSGHHASVGAADVDGDGRKEILLAGPANRLGHYVGVAAVRVPTPAGEKPARRESPFRAATPDHFAHGRGLPALAWYALGPPYRSAVGRSVTVDPKLGEIRFSGFSVEPFALGFDGFAVDVPSALDARARSSARERAWNLLSRASRLADMEDFAGALPSAVEAEKAIGPAADPFLLEWTRRTRARLLVATGEPDAGEELLREIVAAAKEVVPIAFDAARTLHLAGEVRRSLAWYERAALGNGGYEEAWVVQAALEHAVLACLERREPERALSLVERAMAAEGAKTELRDLVSWRSGRRVPLRPDVVYSTSLRRYWCLEERLGAGDQAPAALLAEAVREQKDAAEARELFGLVEAELLLRSGKAREAWDRAGPAFSTLWARRRRDVAARSHLDLAADRAARAAESVGRRAEAAKIRSEVRRFFAAAR